MSMPPQRPLKWKGNQTVSSPTRSVTMMQETKTTLCRVSKA